VNDDTNEAPSVTITTPSDGAVFFAPPGLVPICAEAVDRDGFIRQVEFLGGDKCRRHVDQRFRLRYLGSGASRSLHSDRGRDRQQRSTGYVWTRADFGPDLHGPTGSRTPYQPDSVHLRRGHIQHGCGEPEPFSVLWKVNGVVLPGATSTNLVLRSLKLEDAGDYTVEVRTPCRTNIQTARLILNGAGLQNPAAFESTGPIAFPDGVIDDQVPFTPSEIDVRCIPGALRELTVTLHGLAHTFIGDADVILISPSGKALTLLSDLLDLSGIVEPVSDVTLTFSDEAVDMLPEFMGTVESGVYQPTNYPGGGGDPRLPSNVSTVGSLAAFIGDNPNGKWTLWLGDDENLEFGSIAGWSMSMAWDDTVPILSRPTILGDGSVHLTLSSHAGRNAPDRGFRGSRELDAAAHERDGWDGYGHRAPASLDRTDYFYRVLRLVPVFRRGVSVVARGSALRPCWRTVVSGSLSAARRASPTLSRHRPT